MEFYKVLYEIRLRTAAAGLSVSGGSGWIRHTTGDDERRCGDGRATLIGGRVVVTAMAQDSLTSSHSRPATIRTMVASPEAASHTADVQQVKVKNISKQRSGAEDTTHMQVLNFHPVLGQVKSFGRTEATHSLAAQNFEEQYWMLPGAIFTDL
ncbi:hypothetical protein O3P69_002971 [Scylla paramamosain]|uniref:Uncharacterized protein n=1 Tax=Scylla paramamosain TaxID=85552 RepID=A0AAW0UKE8_SCYPA